MTRTTAERIIGEGAEIRKDVYSRLLLAGRAGHLDGPDDPRLIDYLEFAVTAEGHGRVISRRDDFGARFVDSPTWKAFNESNTMAGFAAEHASVPIMDPAELHKAATLVWPGSGRQHTDENNVGPLLTAVFDMVNVIPATAQIVRPMSVTATEVAGAGLPAGAASVEVTIVGSGADVELIRFAEHANATRALLDDSEQARRLINDLMRRHLLRNLAFEIIAGDGSTTATRKQLLGVNSKSGVGSVAVATADYTTALLTAIQTVEAAGYEGPHVLVAAPLDKRKFLAHAAFLRDRVPTLERIVGFNRLTAGTAFVGSYSAANLYMTPVTINVSQDHATNWVTGLATIQPETFAYLDIPNPGAFCKITGV